MKLAGAAAPLNQSAPLVSPYLRRFVLANDPTTPTTVVIPALPPCMTIANDGASQFTSIQVEFFVRAKQADPAPATPEAKLSMYKVIDSGTFAELFGSLGRPLTDLAVTEGQVVEFCRTSRHLCGPGWQNLFLVQGTGDEPPYIVLVNGWFLALEVYEFAFDDPNSIDVSLRYCIVVREQFPEQ